MTTPCETSDLLVFSHYRWDFIFHRPQHLLSRQAKYRRVFYFEEPIFGMTELPRLHLRETSENILVVVPYLPSHIESAKIQIAMVDLIDELVYEEELIDYSLWYDTPKALAYSRHLEPRAVIFDYLDDHPLLKDDLEDELLGRADVVFAAGYSLYEAKKNAHHNIHPVPNSIDFSHFSQARQKLVEPDDQVNIPHPRIGYYGIIDKRLDTKLLTQIADMRPDYHFVVIGPMITTDAMELPKKINIHYLGKKDYHALPLYLAGWDCAMMPFSLNELTKFICPTKTPEFLAAGRPVVSTAISDVVHHYGHQHLVHIANSSKDFIDAIELAMEEKKLPDWPDRVDDYLKDHSWDNTFRKIAALELKLNRTGTYKEGNPRTSSRKNKLSFLMRNSST